MINLDAVPPEIRERLAEWVALAETHGVTEAAAKLAEHNERELSAFLRAATAVDRLLQE